MHLCLITSSYPAGPADLALPFLPAFVAGIRARGHRVTVLAPDRRPAPRGAPPLDSRPAPASTSPPLAGRRSGVRLERSPESPLPLGDGQGEGVPGRGHGGAAPSFADAPRASTLKTGRSSPAAASPHSNHDVLWFPWLGGARPVVSLGRGGPADLAIAAHLHAAGFATAVALHGRQPIDHVLALFAVPAGLVAFALRRAIGTPYSAWALGSDVLVLGRRAATRPIVARVLRDADHRFADGHGLADEVTTLTGRPCGFLPTVRPLPAPAPVPIDPARRNLLFLGRLEPVKGIDLLLEAFPEVAAAHPDVDLHVVGNGSLRGLVERAGGRVLLHPPADAAQVAGYLASCDALVLPSRSESIPTTLIEAASAGLPTIAASVGDVPRVVGQYGLGAVVPPGDVAALRRALLAWAGTTPSRLPSATVERVRADFSPDLAAARFLATIGA